MKNFKTKLIIFSVLISSIACNTENNSIIIKKTIKPVNNSSISGTVTFTQENDLIVVTGSLYLCGNILSYLGLNADIL